MSSAGSVLDERLVREWDELADRAGAPPWLRPGWIEAWWRAWGRGEPEAVVVRRGDRLAGLAPMLRQGGELRPSANWHSPSFGILAEDAGAAREVADALLRTRPRRASLSFVRDDDAPTLESAAGAAADAGYATIVRTIERSPYVALATGVDAWEASLEKKLRTELRRRRRRLEEQGEVAVEVHDGTSRLGELLAEGLAVEAAAWKGERGTAIASDPATRRFYEEVSAWGAERGWLRLAFLRLDGRPLAFDLCFEAGGEHALLKTGYEPAQRRLAPGLLLREAMIRRAFELGLRSYEFLGQDDPWKLQWTRTIRELKLVQVFAPSPLGRVDRLAWSVGRPAVKRVLALARR